MESANTKKDEFDYGGLILNVIGSYLMITGLINIFIDYGFFATVVAGLFFPVAMLFGVPDFLMLMISILDALVN